MNDLQAVYKTIALEVQQKLAAGYFDRQSICKVIRIADKSSKTKVSLRFYKYNL